MDLPIDDLKVTHTIAVRSVTIAHHAPTIAKVGYRGYATRYTPLRQVPMCYRDNFSDLHAIGTALLSHVGGASCQILVMDYGETGLDMEDHRYTDKASLKRTRDALAKAENIPPALVEHMLGYGCIRHTLIVSTRKHTPDAGFGPCEKGVDVDLVLFEKRQRGGDEHLSRLERFRAACQEG